MLNRSHLNIAGQLVILWRVAGFEKTHRHDKDLAAPNGEAERRARRALAHDADDRDSDVRTYAQQEVRLWQLLDREREKAAERGAADAGTPARIPAGCAVDNQSIGEAFARTLADDELEQMIAYLIHRRDRADLDALDREVATSNLAVLAAESARRGRPSGALDRDAVRALIREAALGTKELTAVLQPLAASRDGLRNHPLTEHFLEHAIERLAWVADTLAASGSYVELATSTGGQAGAALLAMAVTRAQATHVALAILRPWSAFLQLHDRVAMLPLLQLEHRFRVLDAEQRGVNVVLAQLTAFDPGSVAAASAEVPDCVAALATAFETMLADVEHAEEIQRWVLRAQLVADLVTFAAGLRGMFAMRGPPSAMTFPMPALAGAGLGGAAAMGQVVVSTEWIAAIRHLVEIGAISVAGAAEALRVRGVTAAMAQATDLPQAVKDLLGEGPTTDAMKVTNATGAGTARSPRHHVLPQEHRAFFEQRGFTGDFDIDHFTVELDTAHHQAQHGGGNWQMGRKEWPGEWNRFVMDALWELESQLGRRMTVAEIMHRVERLMKQRFIPVRFVPYGGG
ncbi:MAG TPA: hypothetical protein VNO30_24020 [Kofleriaceae bacterium]|nr:hypothetical protein [Kofleriaceae bacterium]